MTVFEKLMQIEPDTPQDSGDPFRSN